MYLIKLFFCLFFSIYLCCDSSDIFTSSHLNCFDSKGIRTCNVVLNHQLKLTTLTETFCLNISLENKYYGQMKFSVDKIITHLLTEYRYTTFDVDINIDYFYGQNLCTDISIGCGNIECTDKKQREPINQCIKNCRIIRYDLNNAPTYISRKCGVINDINTTTYFGDSGCLLTNEQIEGNGKFKCGNLFTNSWSIKPKNHTFFFINDFYLNYNEVIFKVDLTLYNGTKLINNFFSFKSSNSKGNIGIFNVLSSFISLDKPFPKFDEEKLLLSVPQYGYPKNYIGRVNNEGEYKTGFIGVIQSFERTNFEKLFKQKPDEIPVYQFNDYYNDENIRVSRNIVEKINQPKNIKGVLFPYYINPIISPYNSTITMSPMDNTIMRNGYLLNVLNNEPYITYKETFTFQLNLQSPNLTFTTTINDVCPNIGSLGCFNSSGYYPNVLNKDSSFYIELKSDCLSGEISISTDNNDIELLTKTLNITTSFQIYKINLLTKVHYNVFNVYFKGHSSDTHCQVRFVAKSIFPFTRIDIDTNVVPFITTSSSDYIPDTTGDNINKICSFNFGDPTFLSHLTECLEEIFNGNNLQQWLMKIIIVVVLGLIIFCLIWCIIQIIFNSITNIGKK